MGFGLASRLTTSPPTYIWQSTDLIGREFFLDAEKHLYLPFTKLAITITDSNSPPLADCPLRGLDYDARLAMLQTGREQPVNGNNSYHLIEAYFVRDEYICGYSRFCFAPNLEEFRGRIDSSDLRENLGAVAQFKDKARKMMSHPNAALPSFRSYSKLVRLIKDSNLPASHKNAVKSIT